MDVKKRKKNLDKPKNKQRTKKLKETAKDRMLKLNNSYSNGNFGIWIQCTVCNKWRKAMEYEEEHEVPEHWSCSMSLSGTGNCDEPEKIENENFSPVNFIPGAIVWAKYSGYPWWPGMIEDDPDTEEYYWQDKNGKWFYNVTFLDDKVTRAWVAASSVRSFLDRPKQKLLPSSYAKYSPHLAAAESKARNAINMSVQERLKNFSFAQQFKGKWGAPLPSCYPDEVKEENEKTIIQQLLDEVNDIESTLSSNSDNGSVISLELKTNETDLEISSKRDVEYEKNEKKGRKLQTGACSSKEGKLTTVENNPAHLKIQDDEANETYNESDHETSSKSNSEFEKNKKKGKKLLTEAHFSKERKLANEKHKVAHPKIADDEANKTGMEKDAKTFVLPKGKKVEKTHIKPMKEKTFNNNKDITISLDGADKKGKGNSKNKKADKIMRVSKVKNKKANKLENLEKKIDSSEENKEERRVSIKKIDSKDAQVLNENKEENHIEETLNHCSNSKFQPPVKNNACEDKQSSKSMNNKVAADINLNNAGSIIKQGNFVDEEIANRNLEENKQKDKASIMEKKTKNSKNAENSKSIEENTESENKLKENIVKTLEKNLKSSLESKPMQKNDAPTSNDSSTTFQGALKAENSKRNKKQEKKGSKKEAAKESKKHHLKEDLADSEIQVHKIYSKSKSAASNMQQKKNIKNAMKVDLSTEDLPVSSTEKSNLTNAFKVPTRQTISKKENKVMKNSKTDNVKETEEIIQSQDNGFAYASDEEVKEEISCNGSKKEMFSLSVEMNLQETEEEDSDPFEAE